MKIVKRTKVGMCEGKPAGGPVTHFAAAVAPSGAISALTGDPAQAARLDDAAAARTVEFYAAKAREGEPCGSVTAVEV